MACLFAICTLIFDADQVVTGTALNLLALGATGLAFKMSLRLGFTDRTAPFFEPIHLFSGLQAFNQYILCYLTILLAISTHILIRHTRWGIELTALGEYPAAASAAGIRVNARRAACILFGGLTAGLAGREMDGARWVVLGTGVKLWFVLVRPVGARPPACCR